MNTMIFSQSGQSAGIGFAVPVDTIKRIVPQLIKYGKIIRPGLGITLLPAQMKASLGIEKGLVIASISRRSPARKAGLRGITKDRYGRIFIGDIILEIDGTSVDNFDDIYQVLDAHKAGDRVTIKYLRDDKIKTTSLELIPLN
jgi:S1-C subfamily serine protease